jgi:hypothetical protein
MSPIYDRLAAQADATPLFDRLMLARIRTASDAARTAGRDALMRVARGAGFSPRTLARAARVSLTRARTVTA